MTEKQIEKLRVGSRVVNLLGDTLEVVGINGLMHELKWVGEDGALSEGSEFVVPSHLKTGYELYDGNAERIFKHYKDRLVNECGAVHGRIRFNVVEYLCSFPGIDPVEMAATLKAEGQRIDFDDSAISRSENVRKMKMVEQRCVALGKVDSVDGLVADATHLSEAQLSEALKCGCEAKEM